VRLQRKTNPILRRMTLNLPLEAVGADCFKNLVPIIGNDRFKKLIHRSRVKKHGSLPPSSGIFPAAFSIVGNWR